VRPEHSESRAAVDARVDTLTPFWVVWQLEENTGPKSERLRLGHENIRPMNVNTRFDLVVYSTRFGARDETPAFLNYRMHHLDEIEYDVIWKRFWPLVIEIDEKPENIRLLLHHVQFFAETYRVYALHVKFVKLFKRNLKDSTIHEDVCPRTLVCEPFLHTTCKGQRL
jgi:hypothetical protein